MPVPARHQGHVVRQPFAAVFELEKQLLFRFVQRDGGMSQLAQVDQDGQAFEEGEQGVRGKVRGRDGAQQLGMEGIALTRAASYRSQCRHRASRVSATSRSRLS